MNAPATTRVAVIPARGGSKRIARKNVRPVDGRPLLAWAVRTCLDSGLFARIVVTTDDEEIAAIAREAGAEVPFVRSAELSDDHTPLVPVVSDALERIGADDSSVVCCVYPTALGLLATDLTASVRLVDDAQTATYVVGVVRYSHPIQRALIRDEDGHLSMVDTATSQTRTQDLEPRWHDAGQFVWARASTWRRGLPVLTNAVGYELPAWRAIDLDTEDDWLRAELVHRLIRGQALG